MKAIHPVRMGFNNIPYEVKEFAREICDMAKDKIEWQKLIRDQTLNNSLSKVDFTYDLDNKSKFLTWKLKIYTQPCGKDHPKHLLECMYKEYVRTHIMDVWVQMSSDVAHQNIWDLFLSPDKDNLSDHARNLKFYYTYVDEIVDRKPSRRKNVVKFTDVEIDLTSADGIFETMKQLIHSAVDFYFDQPDKLINLITYQQLISEKDQFKNQLKGELEYLIDD